jgi:hypothetical protein
VNDESGQVHIWFVEMNHEVLQRSGIRAFHAGYC